MATLKSYAGHTLSVLQPSMWKNRHEIRDGETVLVRLNFTSVVGNQATGEFGDRSWSFRQSGVWKPVLTVREAPTDAVVAEIPVSPFKRTFEFTLPERSHEPMSLSRNFLATKFTLMGHMGRELVTFTTKPISFSKAQMTLGRRADLYEELPWLAMLVLYVAVKTRRSGSHAHGA